MSASWAIYESHKHRLRLTFVSKYTYTFRCRECGGLYDYVKETIYSALTKKGYRSYRLSERI